jgi:hypothetical protein
MIKILVLQQWYSLSDQRMERELTNNLSIMNFLGLPETIPDSATIWPKRGTAFTPHIKQFHRLSDYISFSSFLHEQGVHVGLTVEG